MVNESIVPSKLKGSLVHPIQKKGKPNHLPPNYRGITITPFPSPVPHVQMTLFFSHPQSTHFKHSCAWPVTMPTLRGTKSNLPRHILPSWM
jgi:hypothetical protein